MGTIKEPARRAGSGVVGWREEAGESCPCGTAESETFALAQRPRGARSALDAGSTYIELIRAEDWLRAPCKGI